MVAEMNATMIDAWFELYLGRHISIRSDQYLVCMTFAQQFDILKMSEWWHFTVCLLCTFDLPLHSHKRNAKHHFDISMKVTLLVWLSRSPIQFIWPVREINWRAIKRNHLWYENVWSIVIVVERSVVYWTNNDNHHDAKRKRNKIMKRRIVNRTTNNHSVSPSLRTHTLCEEWSNVFHFIYYKLLSIRWKFLDFRVQSFLLLFATNQNL